MEHSIDREKVIKGLDSCAKWMSENDGEACDSCPYHPSHFSYDDNDCITALNTDAITLLKDQEAIIEQYRKADGFLAVHGWKWEGR